MSYQHLLLEVRGAIAVVRLNRPDARNALSAQLMRELIAVAAELKPRTDLQAVVLTGAAAYFTAGADLKDPERADRATRTLLEQREHARLGPDLCTAWEALEQVTIVAIEGYCTGGGVALAVACDFRIAGEGASLRLPEIALGMNMSWGAIPRLVALAGPARTKRFVMFSEPLDAATALSWGLCDALVPAGQALAAALAWAEKLCALPPLALRMTKQSVNATANALHAATAFMDRDQFLLAMASDDAGEGVRAFLERRTPRFTGD